MDLVVAAQQKGTATMDATKTLGKDKAVNVKEQYDPKLNNALRFIINCEHHYVNPTLKRLSTLCMVRHNKLQTTK